MRAPEIPGAFDAVAALVRALQGRVYLVSKCGERIEARTRRWLVQKRFFDRTGLPRENLRFCRERRDKVGIAQALKLDREDRFGLLLATGADAVGAMEVHPLPEGVP